LASSFLLASSCEVRAVSTRALHLDLRVGVSHFEGDSLSRGGFLHRGQLAFIHSPIIVRVRGLVAYGHLERESGAVARIGEAEELAEDISYAAAVSPRKSPAPRKST
jgi:hypothetical protein